MESEIFHTKRAGFFGQKPIGRGALAEWMADIARRVERLEAALGDRPKTKQLKIKGVKLDGHK